MTLDIYNNGDYLKNNPTIHSEDAEYKFSYICDMLKILIRTIPQHEISILDIGGGSGKLGKMVCDFFLSHGKKIHFDALDLSIEMLEIQKRTNPYIRSTFHNPIESIDKHYDLILLIDVIEHIPNFLDFTQEIKKRSSYIVFNIPIEKNFFDFAKNIYFKGQYYKWQEETLGHIHFFSYWSAYSYLKSHYKILATRYPQYAQHILSTDTPNYLAQKQNRLRYAELRISKWIAKYCKYIAPFIVQGSLFSLVETNHD